jgi:hypothetical protein
MTLHAHCTGTGPVQGPKEFMTVDQVKRLGNGKADYRWAKPLPPNSREPHCHNEGDRLPGQRALR